MGEVSAEDYRRVMGHFLTGVTVVAAIDEGRLKGFTANAFSALSMDPPLALVCANHRSSTLDSLRSVGRFSISLLAHDQEELARCFASKENDKAKGHRWKPSERGCPVLEGTMGTIECRLFREYDGGDHAIVVGAVEAMSVRPELEPLVYFRGDLFGLGDLAQAVGARTRAVRESCLS